MKQIKYIVIILSLSIFSLSAQNQDASDPAKDLSKELTAVIIGSGSPLYDPERAGPSVLIRYNDQNILVDMGNGSQANLEKLGFNFRQLKGIFITHHHLDHTEEFIPVFIKTLLGGNKFEIAGPAPTAEYVKSILSIYKKDIEYRFGRRGGRDYSAVKNNFNVKELKGGESFSIGDIKISTAAVNHTIETVAYRFEAGGKSIVVSGDLTYSESLSKLSKDADILIIDSGAVIRTGGRNGRVDRQSSGNGQNQGQTPNRQGRMQSQQQSERAHSSLAEVGKMAGDADIKKLIMTHLPNIPVNEEATKAEISKSFKGEIVFAKDLMEIEIR